jgi:hypothetical protein
VSCSVVLLVSHCVHAWLYTSRHVCMRECLPQVGNSMRNLNHSPRQLRATGDRCRHAYTRSDSESPTPIIQGTMRNARQIRIFVELGSQDYVSILRAPKRVRRLERESNRIKDHRVQREHIKRDKSFLSIPKFRFHQ